MRRMAHIFGRKHTERELQGVFAVQDEITRAIVDALKIKLAVAADLKKQKRTIIAGEKQERLKRYISDILLWCQRFKVAEHRNRNHY